LKSLKEAEDKTAVVMSKDMYMDNKDEIDQQMGDDTVIKLVDENTGGDDLNMAISALQSELPQLLSNFPPAMVEIISNKLYWAVMDGYDEYRRASIAQGDSIDEVNKEVMQKFIDQYGKEKGKQVYYATANKQDRDPETFHTENDGEDYERASREIEYDIHPERDQEAWEELMQQANSDNMNEEGDVAPEQEQNVNVEELKADVQKFMDRLNLGQFEAVLAKINTPIEQSEVIASFAERIGVPRAKLPMIIKQMRVQAESVKPRMKKSDLVEHVLRKNKK
jgi:hypothetical protein